MIGLLLAIQCLDLRFDNPQQMCVHYSRELKYYARDYNEKLMLMGRVKELEDAYKALAKRKGLPPALPGKTPRVTAPPPGK